jgi:hypothetical protein
MALMLLLPLALDRLDHHPRSFLVLDHHRK